MKPSMKLRQETEGRRRNNPIDRRQAQRVAVRCRIMYSGSEDGQVIMGDGIVMDLSQTGCKVQGNQSVKVGTLLSLFIHLEGAKEPFYLAQARVASVSGHQFGVKLPKLTEEERRRLRNYLWENIKGSEVDHSHAEFRILNASWQ